MSLKNNSIKEEMNGIKEIIEIRKYLISKNLWLSSVINSFMILSYDFNNFEFVYSIINKLINYPGNANGTRRRCPQRSYDGWIAPLLKLTPKTIIITLSNRLRAVSQPFKCYSITIA